MIHFSSLFTNKKIIFLLFNYKLACNEKMLSMVGAFGLFLLRKLCLRFTRQSLTSLRSLGCDFFRYASLSLACSKATFARRKKYLHRRYFSPPAYDGLRFELQHTTKQKTSPKGGSVWWAL